MERPQPKTTFEFAKDFYKDKVQQLQERASLLPEGDVHSAIDIFEQIEDQQLKLKQITRRHTLGLLK